MCPGGIGSAPERTGRCARDRPRGAAPPRKLWRRDGHSTPALQVPPGGFLSPCLIRVSVERDFTRGGKQRRRGKSLRKSRLQDWLGGRDSNPDNVVQRAAHRLRCASIPVVLGHVSLRPLCAPPSISMRFCASCLIVSHTRSDHSLPPYAPFGWPHSVDRAQEHRPARIRKQVSRRRPSTYSSGRPVQHFNCNTCVALNNTCVVCSLQ